MVKTLPKRTAKEPEHKVPMDLLKVLKAEPKVKALWDDITQSARYDFIRWIEGAKLPETRTRRIGIARDKLKRGDRRPCCYAVVPMNFYKALTGTPGAKVTWKLLSPMAKREFVAWIDEAKDKEAQANRIMEACVKLSAGKQRPLK